MSAEKLDHVTGIATTGHEWDGIRELNTPLPRWWLWLFYICIVWGIGYLYRLSGDPARLQLHQGVARLPSRATISKQTWQRSRRSAAQSSARSRRASLADIEKNPQMLTVARAHRQGGLRHQLRPLPWPGRPGRRERIPNLNDDQWIWGGTLDQIHQTIQHGIR